MGTIKEHQEMGYDRSVGMFSPNGILLQVEYAEKAVNLGSSVIGICTSEGVVFLADRRISSSLLVKESFKKTFKVDEHIAISGAGVMSDGRRLIEQAQIISQEHNVKFQNPINLISLVKDIANIKQHYAQTGGVRPFGVQLLIAGIEEGVPILYQTTPSGMYFRYLAKAVGKHSHKIDEFLEEKYSKEITNKQAISIGLEALKNILDKDFNKENIEITTLSLENKLETISN